jgi:hypothetical protein
MVKKPTTRGSTDMLFDDLPLFRDCDPITSKKGGKAVAPRRASQAMLLLSYYQYATLTDEQAGMASGLALKPRCCYWKRCSELRALGYIRDTGQTRISTAGSPMMVCEITHLGKMALL